MAKSMYEIIKRQNGEAFSRAIRDYDSGIFDIPNLPHILKHAGRNPLPLLRFLTNLKTKEKSLHADTLNPFELLQRAGYRAFYADTLEKQNSIAPYFADGEELCTFTDSNRFKKYYIIHAIKEGANTLNRSDFNNKEKREDTYGTSVISIQILKTGGFIKITNRYNHIVPACDNTFNSNPDNIIPGLSRALKNYFEVDFAVSNIHIPDGFLYINNDLYKYEHEVNNCFFGNGFYFKDGIIHPIDTDCQIIVDEFIIDLKNKKILNPANSSSVLYQVLQNEAIGNVWQIQKRCNRHVFSIDNKEILSFQNGVLKTLFLRRTDTVDSFLTRHPHIEELHGYSLLKIGSKSLSGCPQLRYVHLPRCEHLEENCLEKTSAEIEAPLLKKQGIYFISGFGINVDKKELISRGILPPKLYDFLKKHIHTISNLCVVTTQTNHYIYADDKLFLKFHDQQLVDIHFPDHIEYIESGVLMDILYLQEVSGMGVRQIENANLIRCPHLQRIGFPHLQHLGFHCIVNCDLIEELSFPELQTVPTCTSICNNNHLRYIYAPLLTNIPDVKLLPALERFDCKKGFYLREKPTWITTQSIPHKFVFVPQTEHDNR